MTRPPQHRTLRLLTDSDAQSAAPEFVDAWRVEVWVSTYGTRPWMASSAIVDSTHAARLHAKQSVSGLVVDGIEPGAIFVGAILGQVQTERAGDLDPGWEPHADEPVSVAVIDDGDRLGLWMQEPPYRWRARTGMTTASSPAPTTTEQPTDDPHPAGDPS